MRIHGAYSKSFYFLTLLAYVAVAPGDMRRVGVPVAKYDTVNNKFIKWCDTTKTDQCQCDKGLPSSEASAVDASPSIGCVQIDISMGRARFSALTEAIVLQLNEVQPSSALYSPSGFRVVAGVTLHSISREKNASGVPKSVNMTDSSGVVVSFSFKDGESVGFPRNMLNDSANDRLVMVDAQGWATTSDPAFYDYYPGDGSRWRFGASPVAPNYQQFVEQQTPQGRVETMRDMGLEIIRNEDGQLRQVLSVAWLADFQVIGQDAYDIRIYPNNGNCLSGEHSSDGSYRIVDGAAASVVWEFRNPNPGLARDLHVTKRVGDNLETWEYQYQEAVQDFTLTCPHNVKTDQLERHYSDDGKSWVIIRTIRGSDGEEVFKEAKHYIDSSDGSVLVSSVRDPDGLKLTETYGYYTNGVRAGLLRDSLHEDGSWTHFDYDDMRRKTLEVSPWLDSDLNAPLTQCAVRRYSYTPCDPDDLLAYNDQRPRTEIKEICGVEVSRTYHAYPTNALGQAQEIEERAAFPGAPYGHASNPRTVKTYHASSAALPLPGRLATVAYPGGKTETCGYEYGTFNAATFVFTPDPGGGAWRETVTTSYPSTPHSALPTPKSTRSVRVWDEKGREVLNESCVEDGASFAVIGWTRMTYDRNGKLIETAYSDGRIVSATWGANCCGKESETSVDGIITVFGYNTLKQKISETKLGFAADGSDDITTLHTYDSENRLLSTSVTNIASGLGYCVSRKAYDKVGRVTNSVDSLENATVTIYESVDRTVRDPNGVIVVTERHLDGKTKRVIENGVVQKSYAYGVCSDGTRWTLSADGALPASITTQLLGTSGESVGDG